MKEKREREREREREDEVYRSELEIDESRFIYLARKDF